VALVNCLNFGNPEHPEVMWQLSEAIDGMAEACRALGVPVIGGNVSLYNESRGRDIDPTPVVGTLGLVDRLERRPPGIALAGGSTLLLLGAASPTSLGGSRWAVERRGHRGGSLAPLDLDMHGRLLGLVASLVGGESVLDGVHDVSDGGLGVALAEMAVRSGVGFEVSGIGSHQDLFGEGPSRVVVCVPPARLDGITRRADEAAVAWTVLGTAGGDRLIVDGLVDVSVPDAVEAWRGALLSALVVA
jgi:phosphoribosylformylglycinamidine synthase